MLTTVKGYYDNGKIILSETPHVQNKSDVLVTFLNGGTDAHKEEKRRLGILSGKISIPDNFNDECNDFNEH
jgi:hypothetical protein